MSKAIGNGMEHVAALAAIGKRPTGSQGERQAAEYLCTQLRAWGLAGVAIEEFAARGWDFSACRVQADGVGNLDALPIEFSGSTGHEGVVGELIVFESPEDVRGAQIQGKIVLTQGTVPAAESLLDGGAAGLIVVDPGRPRAWHIIYGPEQPLAGKLPMVTLGFGDAVDLLKQQVSRVTIQVATTIEEVTGLNVVATLPGSTQRRLNVSAHYDSVPSGPAAADNATGAACALEVVRTLSRTPLDATVDLVLFSAEEIGLYGAAAYAARHADALEHTELGVYYDGQGDFLGRSHIHTLGQEALAHKVRELITGIGYAADVQHHFTGLDQVFLSAHGVPTLWLQRGPQLTWHTPADVIEDVSPEAMRAAIAAGVEIIRHVAEHPNAFPGGIPEDQTSRIRDYVSRGAPVW